jgi:hypothetical protein
MTIETLRVVDVTGDSVWLTTIVLVLGATVEVGVAGFELALGLGLVVEAVASSFAVAQYRE